MFSNRLRQLRKQLKLSQEELAKRINTTKGTISNYENEYSTPSNDVLIDLATVLDTTTDFLLGRTDDVNSGDSNHPNNPNEEDEQLKDFMKDLTVWYHNEPEAEKDLEVFRRIMQTYNKDKK